MANALQQVTLFLDDTHTIDGDVVTHSSDITPAIASCSTDPTHRRPSLVFNVKGIDKYTNLTQGVTAVSQSSIVIQDTRTIPTDQQSGWLTHFLPDLIGQRIVEQQMDPFSGTFKVTIDGIITGIEVNDSQNQLTLIQLTVKDIRERERGLVLFARAESTVIYPRDKSLTGIAGYGVAGGWGRVNPSDPNSATLIPDAKGKKLKYVTNTFDPNMPVGAFIFANAFDWVFYDSGGQGSDEWNQGFMRYIVSGYDPTLDGGGETALGSKMTGQILTGMTVQWRAWGTGDAWKTLRFMPYWKLGPSIHPPALPHVGTATGAYLGFASVNGRIKDDKGQVALQFIVVSGDGTSNFVLPANNQNCEVRVLSGLPPDEKAPMFLELPGGDFLQNAYDGVYSPELTDIRYNVDAMAAIKPKVPLLRAIITEMEEDGKTWLEENWYKTYGYIPQVNDNGELEPYEWKVPDASVPLTILDDSNIINAKWNHEDSDTINQVNFWYFRDFINKDGNLSSVQVSPNELNAPGIVALGTHPIEYKPVTVRDAVQDANGYLGQADRNFRTQELGFQIFKARVADVLDRFKLGGHHLNATALKSDPYVRALREGSWCVVGVSWLPDYASRRRGLSRLMQVVKISDTDPLVRGLELVDAGEHDEPLAAPTELSATISDDNRIIVDVIDISDGASARLEVASTPTLPAATSGDWLFGDQQEGVGGMTTLSSIPMPPGTIWYRIRDTQNGRRPSAWIGLTSVIVPTTAKVSHPALTLSGDGTLLLTWTPTNDVVGIRVYMQIQFNDIPAPAALPSYADVIGTAGTLVLPQLPPNNTVYLSVEAYPGFVAGSVTGAAGVYTPLRAVERPALNLTPTIELDHATPVIGDGLTVDIGLKISSPQNLGGTLRVWDNIALVGDPVITANPDGSIVLPAAQLMVVDEATDFTAFGGGTVKALNNVRVHPTQGKLIFAEFTDTVGNTTGKRTFMVRGSGSTDDTGGLKPGSINNALQYAENMTPIEAWPISVDKTTPNDRPIDTFALDTNTGRLFTWNGVHWIDVVSAPNLTGLLTGAQITNATLTPDKVSASATLPQVVTNISSASSGVSKLALETATGKLYRWNGSTWVATTAATDLTGTIIATQLGAGVVDITKVASGLTMPQVVANISSANSTISKLALETSTGFMYRWAGSAWVKTVPATDITGQVIASQIADATINSTKIASGLTLPQTVSTITSANSALSPLAFETSTGFMYRWTGSAWVRTVPTTDLTGTIASGQIAAGAIGSTQVASGLQLVQQVATIAAANSAISKVALNLADGKLYHYDGTAWVKTTATSDLVGTVTSTQIADNSISSPKIQTNAVIAAKIGAGEVIAGKLATDAVTAGTIAAAAISAREIQSAAISGDKIQAGVLTADKFYQFISTGSALNSDTGTDNTAWVITNGPGVIDIGVDGKVGAKALASLVASGTQGVYTDRRYMSLDFANKTYRMHAWVYSSPDANGLLYLGLRFYSETATSVELSHAYATGISAVSPAGGVWTEYSGLFTVVPPAGTKYARVYVLLNYAGTTGYMYAQDVRIEEVIPGTLIKDGAITTQKITALNVTSGLLAAGAVTAGKISTDAVEAGTIAAAAITSRELHADAVTATKLAANAVIAGKISAGAVQAGNIAAAAVQAGNLDANAVTAGTVTAGVIGSQELAAGAVTAGKLFIYGSTGAALNDDSGTSDLSAWTSQGNTLQIVALGSSGKTGSNALASPVGGSSIVTGVRYIPLDPQKVYRIRAWVYRTAASNGKIYMGVVAYNGSFATVAWSGGGNWYTTINQAPAVGVWTEFVGYIGPNQLSTTGISLDAGASGALWMRPYILLNYSGTAGATYVQDFRIEEVTPGTLIQDGAITTGKVAADAIQAGQIHAGAVEAGDIAANGVIAGNINAGVITGREIFGATITTDKLLVTGGQGAALNDDPETRDATAWIFTFIAGHDASIFSVGAGGKTGVSEIRSNTNQAPQIAAKNWATIDPTKVYRVRAWVRRSATANGAIYLGVAAVDSTEVNINGPAGGFWYTAINQTPAANVWTEYVGTVGPGSPPGAFPANARKMRLIALMNYGGTVGYYEIQDFRLEEILPGTLIQDGAITTGKMTANAINGDRITSGTLDAGKINAGTIAAATAFLNNIQAGTVTAAAIIAQGAAIGALSAISANIGTIDAGLIYNTNHTAYFHPDSSLASPGAAYLIYSPSFSVRNDGAVFISGEVHGVSGDFAGTISSSTFTSAHAIFTGASDFHGTIKLIQSGVYGENPDGALRFYNTDQSNMIGEIRANWSTPALEFLSSGALLYFFSDTMLIHYQGDAPVEIQRVFHAGATGTSIFKVSDDTKGSLFTVDIPTVNNDTGISFIYRDQAGNYSFKRLRGDNVDTGGSGNRNIRILN